MKIFGTDVGAKYIFLTINGKRYDILFHDSIIKGVHDIQVLDDHGVADYKVIGKYPPLKKVIGLLLRADLPCYIGSIKRRLLHNR